MTHQSAVKFSDDDPDDPTNRWRWGHLDGPPAHHNSNTWTLTAGTNSNKFGLWEETAAPTEPGEPGNWHREDWELRALGGALSALSLPHTRAHADARSRRAAASPPDKTLTDLRTADCGQTESKPKPKGSEPELPEPELAGPKARDPQERVQPLRFCFCSRKPESQQGAHSCACLSAMEFCILIGRSLIGIKGVGCRSEEDDMMKKLLQTQISFMFLWMRMMMMMMSSSSTEKMKKKPPKDSLTLLPCFYFVELPIVASSMVSLYFLELTDVVQPAQVGFRCHDRDLSMPYVDGGDELIPLLMLLSLAFAGPAASASGLAPHSFLYAVGPGSKQTETVMVVQRLQKLEIMLVEAVIYCLQPRLKIHRAEGSINAGGCSFNSFLRRTVRFVGVHVFGLCATALLTDIIQLSTGYHAPFFLTVCKPNYTMAGVSCDQNAYITKDICSGHDQHAIMAARRTFPSQHATLSAFAAVYVSMYFNSTISDSTKLLKPVLVFAFAIAAALSGLTQITQHRSHPIDVYVGFLIGSFISVYLALHAVANFKCSDEFAQAAPPPPPMEDPLRALTERGHESVYNKGPASASESNDEIAAAPAPIERLEGLGPLQREKGSMGSLKRASVDVELLVLRSPMGKETMLTFSNTLPRTSMNVNGPLGTNEVLGDPVPSVQPVQRRLKAVQVPVDPMRSQQLVTEWKQKSMEMRGLGAREDVDCEPSEDSSEVSSVGTDDAGSQAPIYQPSVQPVKAGLGRNPTPPPPGGTKAVATPRPPQIPEAGPPPVSPKSALTRAKWLAIREKTSGEGSVRGAANQPRLMQIIAMSKQQGLLPSSSSGEKSSETTSTGSGTSSNTDSPHCRHPSEHKWDGPGIITVDAHAPYHPIVQTPPLPQAPTLAGNGNPWEWATASNGDGPRDSYDLNKLNRGDSAARASSFCPHRSASPAAVTDATLHVELSADAQRREMAMRRKTALVLLDREIRNQTEQENYYKSLQGRRFKD
ncbi:hypothetical protein CRENBAI_023286 [Crenichthys baileyi]|uniref:Phospholipid phosphatase-related protein type 3 n=1 Tax=Crenichthys baileyi TaxID=28760 RepID=A0AAV9QS46_9TELE